MNIDALLSLERRDSPVYVEAEPLEHGRRVRYVGAKDDLIAEGYATEAMFPKNARGVTKGGTDYVRCRYGSFCHNWQITGRKDGPFNLYTTWTEWTD